MAEGTIYHRVDSELCSQSEHGICDRRLVDLCTYHWFAPGWGGRATQGN